MARLGALVLLGAATLVPSTMAHVGHHLEPEKHQHQLQEILSSLPSSDSITTTKPPVDPLPATTRQHWMRQAISLLPVLSTPASPCPFNAFVSVVVNHTLSYSDPTYLGDFVCSAINGVFLTGNPTKHGEVAAIDACTSVLAQPPYSLTAPEGVMAAFQNLSLYTTAEPCAMCSGAILWSGFKDAVFGTNNSALTKMKWPTIMMSSQELVGRAWALGTNTTFYGSVLANETDPFFDWQFKGVNGTCPAGCVKSAPEGPCVPGE